MNQLIMQEKMLEYFSDYPGVGVMIPVHGKTTQFGTDAYFQCRLFTGEAALEEMETDDTNHWRGVCPGFTQYGFDGDVVYRRYNNERGMEPFVIERDYNGLGVDDEIEIVEEFRLVNNLYFDHARNEYRDLESEITVVKIEGGIVSVNRKYLKRYLAVKNMVMIVHICSTYELGKFDGSIKHFEDQSKTRDKLHTFVVSDCRRHNFSQLYSKTVIRGCQLKDCGYWPYDQKDRQYEDFIIGVDKDGEERLYTSDPEKLSNYFGANPGAPHYLTPVFFKREVQRKYYDNPGKYVVEDGIIRCGRLWALYVDNQQDEYVSAYLGDLGRDLPNQQEQQYWKNYNIAIDGSLSESKFKRDFCSMFASPDSPVFVFQNKYKSANELFEKKLGCPLFLRLHDDDLYNLEGLRIPLSNAQPEFDLLVLSLVKVMVDSINEKMVLSRLYEKPEGLNGSISRLEKWLDLYAVENYQTHVRFLRDLQELRSCGTGHRKGKGYERIANALNIAGGDYRKAFKDILCRAIEFLDFMSNNADILCAEHGE